MKKNYIIIEPSDLSDIRSGLQQINASLEALQVEASSKRIRREDRATMLTMAEATQYLRVSRSTLGRWITLGILEPVKAGRRTLFSLEALEKVLTKVNSGTSRGYDYK